MKAFAKIILYSVVIICFLNSCDKTTTISSPSPLMVIPGNITSAGDTLYVSSPNVSFRITRSSPCAPSNEVFFDSITTSSYTNATYQWDFGNGDKGTGTFVSHKYQYGAVFTITLSVVVNNITVQQVTATVRAYGQYVSPVASFGAQLNNYRDPNWVAFNAQSSVTEGSIANYFWEWKDGTTSSVATSYTEHRFPEIEQDSTYPVKLTVTSHAGCKKDTTNKIFIPRAYNNVGGITITEVQKPCITDSQVFKFFQDTTGLPSNAIYEWDLGTGVPYYGNPLYHHFIYTKTYPVVCKITIPYAINNKTIYRNTSVYALGSDIKPTPYVNGIIYLNPPMNDYIQFAGWGKVGDGHIITKLKWEFGDGAVDSLNTPYVFHQYAQPYPANKIYHGRLTVTASSGCVGSDTFSVRIP